MAQTKEHVTNIDRHVQLLEEKVNKLRTSLSHWQQWYLEYSSLKEEVEELPKETPPHEELRRIRRDFDGTCLTKKEINEIIGKNDLRDVEQIVGILSRRLDYVEQNINTLNKLLENEENRLAAATVVANPDSPNDEESGLPITDIIEELDEEDNVVNYRLQSGGDTANKVVDALKKAGIQEKDIPETEDEAETNNAKQESAATDTKGKDKESEDKLALNTKPTTLASESAPADASPTMKKSVSFAEDTKSGHGQVEEPKTRAAAKLEDIMKTAKEQESMDMSTAVIPEDESEEDKQMRREMLEYSMSEIGPVVAELQLEEGDFDDDDDWDFDEDESDEDEDDEEDELGRSKHSVLDSDYIARMQELEKRLGVQSAFAVDHSETKPSKKSIEGIGQIAVVKEVVSETAPPAEPRLKEKKSVSFAPTLDIAPETVSKPAPSLVKSDKPKIDPFGDIVEKTADLEIAEAPEPTPKRVSRFKKERAVGVPLEAPATGLLPLGPHQVPASFIQSQRIVPAEPTPPEDLTLAAAVVERPTPAEVPEPDDMDDVLVYQAAAVEYNRKRNNIIQQQGGFVEREFGEEDGLVPLDEELGGPKKMSKFKAARLAKLQ